MLCNTTHILENTRCIRTHKTLNISTDIPLYYFTSFAPENCSKLPILGDLDSCTPGHKTHRLPYPPRDRINFLLLPHATTALSGTARGAAPLAPPRSHTHTCLSNRGRSLSTTRHHLSACNAVHVGPHNAFLPQPLSLPQEERQPNPSTLY